ncbi:U4/U6 small nuclear ribonucleoprotein prp4 [Pseudocyphellaria aurata]|nr:U4/U6 small nuclear ribonucleoprotein prp4 [Pseudocyphellaria aurata]
MTVPSPSTPSEGEIVESDSEKATTSLCSLNDTNVDRKSRIRVSVSRSPSPYRSPRRRQSRTPSRSPYRESRGAKRLRENDHDGERVRGDSRRFKVKYEDRSSGRKASFNLYDDLDRSREPSLRYESHGAHGRMHPADQSRVVPESAIEIVTQAVTGGTHKLAKAATAPARRVAENRSHQTQHFATSEQDLKEPAAGSASVLMSNSQETYTSAVQPVDEATLIEERRKRREAIKAKHRGQNTPTLVQAALALNIESTQLTSISDVSGHQPPGHVSLHKSPLLTAKDSLGQDSPNDFLIVKGNGLTDIVLASGGLLQEDEPSAADYDPTMDMQEDQIRHDKRNREGEVPPSAYHEADVVDQDVLPDTAANNSAARKDHDGFDMFAEADELDMFADPPVAPERDGSKVEAFKAVPAPQAKALDMSMLDDWDDQEGYYKVILGELLDGRYHVQSNLGKGMFSGVVRATDQRTTRLVAIKLIRNNETMKKAGLKEIEILQKLSAYDPEDKKHMIRLERYFEHKGHLCMVFENLSINLREVLKKFGRDVGINLKAVRAYAQQMFTGLSLLRKCNVLHADLKPDNMLVNDSRNLLKICDLGSASDASENEITPYLVSRFYRAPEIILGMPYDFGIDIWSIGCTLFELYTGKILFTGRSNNQMLRAIMECRGKFSHKILRKAQFAGLHFDDLLNFRSIEKDRLSGKDVVRTLNFTKPSRDIKTRLLANAKGMDDVEIKELNLFVDLLDRCLNLNSDKRCSPAEALKHPFITRMKV